MAQFDWRPIVQAGPPPPPCHGSQHKYDPTHQECRQCVFQNSCRDKVEAARRGAVPVAVVHNPFQPAIPQHQFQPVHQPQQQFHPQPAYFQPPPQVPQNPYLQQYRAVPQQMQAIPVAQEFYGRLQDPMHYILPANPVPLRPQMQGETFMQRVVKNAVLGFGELLCFELGKMFRQMVLPPPPPPQQEIVVQPEQRQIQQGR